MGAPWGAACGSGGEATSWGAPGDPFACRSLQVVDCAPGRVHDPHPWPSQQQQSAEQPLGLLWRKCAAAVRPQDASQGLMLFEGLFKWQPHTFWLDR